MRAAILTLGLVLYTVVSFAGSIADTYVIPVAGHVSGANGETWITDVTLHNVGDSTIVVDLAGIGPDGDVISLNTESATIGAHETVALRDVVRPSAVGALVVAGSGPFTVTTRVYTTGPAGDVGTDVPAVNEFLGPDTGAAFCLESSATLVIERTSAFSRSRKRPTFNLKSPCSTLRVHQSVGEPSRSRRDERRIGSSVRATSLRHRSIRRRLASL